MKTVGTDTEFKFKVKMSHLKHPRLRLTDFDSLCVSLVLSVCVLSGSGHMFFLSLVDSLDSELLPHYDDFKDRPAYK